MDTSKNIAQKYIKMSNRHHQKTCTEIYKDEQHGRSSPKNITQKYIKMSNMDITKKHNTEIYKDEQHGHHQKT